LEHPNQAHLTLIATGGYRGTRDPLTCLVLGFLAPAIEHAVIDIEGTW